MKHIGEVSNDTCVDMGRIIEPLEQVYVFCFCPFPETVQLYYMIVSFYVYGVWSSTFSTSFSGIVLIITRQVLCYRYVPVHCSDCYLHIGLLFGGVFSLCALRIHHATTLLIHLLFLTTHVDLHKTTSSSSPSLHGNQRRPRNRQAQDGKFLITLQCSTRKQMSWMLHQQHCCSSLHPQQWILSASGATVLFCRVHTL